MDLCHHEDSRCPVYWSCSLGNDGANIMKYRRSRSVIFPGSVSNLDPNERYVLYRVGNFVLGIITRYPVMDEETLDIVFWLLGSDVLRLGRSLRDSWDGFDLDLEEDLAEYRLDPSGYSRLYSSTLARAPNSVWKIGTEKATGLLERRVRTLCPKRPSSMERSIEKVQHAFGLSDIERDLFLLLYLVESWGVVESYFKHHLECTGLPGQKYLAAALGTTSSGVARAMRGALVHSGMLDMRYGNVSIDSTYQSILRDPLSNMLPDGLYRAVPPEELNLEAHGHRKEAVDHILGLIRSRGRAPVHILLYGPAGVGKTSFARRLAQESGLPALEVPPDENDRTSVRRMGIIACRRLKNNGDGVVVLVDEADALLNTKTSWLSRGDSQDKAWLNGLLEEQGGRVIWVTNSIHGIEESVLRRFAFSLCFKPFTRMQRVHVWDRILRRRKVKRFFSQDEILGLASRYKSSPGTIDLAVWEAAEGSARTRFDVHRAVTLALDSHEALHNGGVPPVRKQQLDHNYSLDGLNIEGDIPSFMQRLESFDVYLRRSDEKRRMRMNVLLHGPPGTGKSELARYIAHRLDRELIVKRASDLLNPYVGMTERQIAGAFDEAEREEAVLVIDEVDSMLFSRADAVRSWEVSFTNEFLTQMERFRGVLICTTNRLEALDEASIRRFGEKLRFDFLTPEGNVVFYEKMLEPIAQGRLDGESRRRLRGLTGLAPGDFKVVRDRCSVAVDRPYATELVSELAAEAWIKKRQRGGTKVGF